MNLAEYSNYDGIALAELVRKREVSAKELAYLFAEAAKKVNTKINAIIEVYFDRIKELDEHAISAEGVVTSTRAWNEVCVKTFDRS